MVKKLKIMSLFRLNFWQSYLKSAVKQNKWPYIFQLGKLNYVMSDVPGARMRARVYFILCIYVLFVPFVPAVLFRLVSSCMPLHSFN